MNDSLAVSNRPVEDDECTNGHDNQFKRCKVIRARGNKSALRIYFFVSLLMTALMKTKNNVINFDYILRRTNARYHKRVHMRSVGRQLRST